MVSVQHTHRNTVYHQRKGHLAFSKIINYSLSLGLVSLRALSYKMRDPARCGIFDPAKHLSPGLTFIQIGCKHVFRVKHMISYFDESSQSVPRFQL